jgi:RNA polymerase sigma factor (sigma-70 family)
MEDVDDATVIARSRDDPELFAALFDRHFSCLHAFLSRRIGGQADDLAAEVFSIAFECRDRFRPVHTSALPWLYGIASNLLSRHRRSELRRLRALARLEGMEVVANPDGAAGRADASSLRRPLFEALAELHPRDRDALLLVAWEGLTYDEVAAALEIPLGTVRSRLHRARRLIRTELAGCDDEDAHASLGRAIGGFDA